MEKEREREKKGVSELVGLSGWVRDEWGIDVCFSFCFSFFFLTWKGVNRRGGERKKERKKKSTNMMHRFNIDRKPRIRSLPMAFGSGEPVFLLGKIVCFSILNGKNDEFICVRLINQSINPHQSFFLFFCFSDFTWDNR